MITLIRAAYQDNPRASSYTGLSTDNKPTDCENGSYFLEIDTGTIFRFDQEKQIWYEQGGE